MEIYILKWLKGKTVLGNLEILTLEVISFDVFIQTSIFKGDGFPVSFE